MNIIKNTSNGTFLNIFFNNKSTIDVYNSMMYLWFICEFYSEKDTSTV